MDFNGLYNAQNKRIRAVNCGEADGKGGVENKKQKFPQKVMVWLGVCSEGITPFVNWKKERSTTEFTSKNFFQ